MGSGYWSRAGMVNGLRRLILETDSAVLVALLLKEYVKADANSALITKARECFV
jgi:hypothetical protein